MAKHVLFHSGDPVGSGRSSHHAKRTRSGRAKGLAAFIAQSGDLWTPAGYSQPVFFSIVGAQKILSDFSAVQQYDPELRNHCTILLKSQVSCNCTLKFSLGDKKADSPFDEGTILFAWIVIKWRGIIR